MMRKLDDEEADSIIEEFLGSLDLIESNLQVQPESRHHVHWWDGWRNEKDFAEEEEDARFVSFSILEAAMATIGKEKEDNKEVLKQLLDKQRGTVEFSFRDEEDASHGEEDAVWIQANEDELEMLENFEKVENKAFKKIGFQNKNESDDLLMKIVEVEAEWNALIVGSAQASTRNTKKSFEMEPVGAEYSYRSGLDATAYGGGYENAIVFAWKGETFQKYWWCTKKLLDWGQGGGPNLIMIVREEMESLKSMEVIKFDVIWRRLIRSVLEQNLAKLKSSLRLM